MIRRSLPESLGQMSSLLELDVRKNQLTAIPDLSSLSSLQVLDVGENKLSKVIIVLYCIVLYCIVLHCIVLYCIPFLLNYPTSYFPLPLYDLCHFVLILFLFSL